MFLEGWMIVLLVLAFAACAHFSFKSGVAQGQTEGEKETIMNLILNDIIRIKNNKIFPVQQKEYVP